MKKHKQVPLRHPSDGLTEVDEGMADFLRALWRLGLDTVSSCQEVKPGVSLVTFSTADDAAAFLGKVWASAGGDVIDRMECEFDVPGAWEYDATPVSCRDGEFQFAISVRMPVEDKDELAEILGR